MLQNIIIGVVFLGALAYVGRLIYRSLRVKSDCATGCGKCNTIDVNKIEADFKARQVAR